MSFCRSVVTAMALVGAVAGLVAPEPAEAGRNRDTRHEPTGHQTYASPQASPLALSPDGSTLYVASTTSNRVHVIDTASRSVVDAIPVGMEPVSVAVRPGADELWVTNHVSDSVSVIDIDPASASFRLVVETVQAMDSSSLVTRFDEPVGLAFTGDGSKAYVALSSRNDVAVVDAGTYQVTDFLHITAQDPRALAVRNGKLFVAAFESSNKTELSACSTTSPGDQCTLSADDLVTFAQDPNLPGQTKNIVVDPDVPDRDVFVFDTSDDSLIDVVEGVGTLLYGLTVTGSGELFVTQTDARNAANGLQGESLAALENRMFLNQITRVDCGGPNCGSPARIDLEPLPPSDPAAGEQLATPYGIAVSEDASTLVATAAASSRAFTLDRASGTVLDILDVGAIPRGVALRSDSSTGAPQTAYVLNTLGNSVSVVDVSTPSSLSELATVDVGMDDRTPEPVRMGRIAFNDANASSSGTFACASCHPDGHTDQLLWRIGGACFFGDCSGDEEPRSTMPVRGLRDTLPLHWDGTLGDPFGGSNGAIGNSNSEPPDCSRSDPQACFRDLVDATQSGPMCEQPSCPTGPSGLPGRLTLQERDDMATFLERVSYPPARSRRLDDRLTEASDGVTVDTQNGPQTVSAIAGVEDFFRDQGSQIGTTDPNTCADSDAGCHELPLGTATNSETLNGFDAPTMRGMTDRFLQFSLGVTGAEELLDDADDGISLFGGFISGPDNPVAWDGGAKGYEEITTFGVAFNLFAPVYNVGPLDSFQMFEEASNGHSGALGRQVTLNTATTNGAQASSTQALLDALEDADDRGLVNLRGRGLLEDTSVTISYDAGAGVYKVGSLEFTPSELVQEAQGGTLLATLTGQLRRGISEATPQPLIAPPGANCGTVNTGFPTTGDDPALPLLSSGSLTMALEGEHLAGTEAILVDGEPVSGTITLTGGTAVCDADTSNPQGSVTTQPLEISLGSLPATTGMHVLQVQKPAGLLSNELPFVVE